MRGEGARGKFLGAERQPRTIAFHALHVRFSFFPFLIRRQQKNSDLQIGVGDFCIGHVITVNEQKFSKCACSELKTRTCSCPRTPI